MSGRSRRLPTTPAALAAALAAACLTGPAPGSARAAEAGAPNVVRLVMRTPRAGFNRMVLSLTLCEPGTDRCATVDDVMVDTGSTGLRLEASAVPSWLRLPSFTGPDGRPLAECLHFVHDTAWGALYRADLRLGGLKAAGLPLQVIADGGGPQPAACPRSDVRPTSNGTLGIGQHLFDCQGSCEQEAESPGVFADDGQAWVPVRGRVERAYRLPNPVSLLPVHDNGVVVDLPSPPDGGARDSVGTLTFGVGTAGNNRLGPSRILRLDAAGRFTTLFNGRAYPDSSIDSGTETLIFDDARLPRCRSMPWAYCPEPPRRLRAEMLGRDGASIPVVFPVGDYRAARARHLGSSADAAVAAEPGSRAFVWGAPFFLGRRVSVVIDGRAVPGLPDVAGPLYAVD